MRDNLDKEIELWKEIPPLAQQTVLMKLLSERRNTGQDRPFQDLTILETDLRFKSKQCEFDEHQTDVSIAFEAAYKILVLIATGATCGSQQ